MALKNDGPPTGHRPHPVSRAEFARRAGRGASSITEACVRPLRAACLPGGRIDAAHPATLAWALKRGIEPASLLDPVPVAAAPSKRGRGRPTAEASASRAAAEAAAPQYGAPENIGDLLDLPLRAILERHQSLQGFGDWLDKRKKIADIQRTEFSTARARNLFVPREFVEHHIFGLLEATNLRLLREMPVTAVSSLFALAKSGATLEEGQRELRALISSNLKYAADKIAKLIRTPT